MAFTMPRPIILLLFGFVATIKTSSYKEYSAPGTGNDLTDCSVIDEQGVCVSRGSCFKTPGIISERSEECVRYFHQVEDVGCIRKKSVSANSVSWREACKQCSKMHVLGSLATNETLERVKKKKALEWMGVYWIGSNKSAVEGCQNGTCSSCHTEPDECYTFDCSGDERDHQNSVPCSDYVDYLCEIPEVATMSTTCKCPMGFSGLDCRFNRTSGQTEGSIGDFGGASSFQCESDEYLVIEYGANNFSQAVEEGRCRSENVLPLLRSWCQGKKKCNLTDSAIRENCTQLLEGYLELRVNCYPESALQCLHYVEKVKESGSVRCYYESSGKQSWADAKEECTTLGGWIAPVHALEQVTLLRGNKSKEQGMWLQGPGDSCYCTLPSNQLPCAFCDSDVKKLPFVCSLPPRVFSEWTSPPTAPLVDEYRRPSAMTMTVPRVFPSVACKTGPNRTDVPTSTTEATESIRPQFPFAFVMEGEIQAIITRCEEQVFEPLPIVRCVLKGLTNLTDDEERLMNMTDALNTTVSFLEYVDEYLLDSDNPFQLQEVVNDSIRIVSNLLNPERSYLWLDGPNQALQLGRFFLLVEKMGLTAARNLPVGDSLIVHEPYVELLLMNLASNMKPVFRIKEGDGSMTLGELPSGPAVFQRYSTLSYVLSKDYFLHGKKPKLKLGPEALGLGLSNGPASPDVIIAFKRKAWMIPEGNDSCLFFNVTPSEEAFLDYSGCWLHETNDSHIVCRCNHLTTFAMLTNWKGLKHLNDRVLQVMTWIGCVISIFCLLACIIAFSLVKSENGVRNIIHRNLCWCLLVGNIALLAGLRQTDTTTTICMAVAILLHFVYLAAFCWMLVEGVQIMRMVITVFQMDHKIWTFYVTGYGLPAVIVAVAVTTSYVANIPYVTSEEICWLNSEYHMIWSFLGPVALVILINIITLITALRKSQTIKTKSNDGKVKRVRNLARGLLVLSPLLGVTWLFGFLFFDDCLIVFAYLFTVLNSLQGVFIFLFHFLFNEKVRGMVRVKAQRVLGPKEPPNTRRLRAVSSVTSMMTSSCRTTSTSSSDSRRDFCSSSMNSNRF